MKKNLIILTLALNFVAAAVFGNPKPDYPGGQGEFEFKFMLNKKNEDRTAAEMWGNFMKSMNASSDKAGFLDDYFKGYNEQAFKVIKKNFNLEFTWANNVTEFDKTKLALALLENNSLPSNLREGTKINYFVDAATLAERQMLFGDAYKNMAASFGTTDRSLSIPLAAEHFNRYSWSGMTKQTAKIGKSADGKSEVLIITGTRRVQNGFYWTQQNGIQQYVPKIEDETYTVPPLPIASVGGDLEVLRSALAASPNGEIELKGPQSWGFINNSAMGLKFNGPVTGRSTDKVIIVSNGNLITAPSFENIANADIKGASVLAVGGVAAVKELAKKKAALKISSAEDKVNEMIEYLVKPKVCKQSTTI